MQPVLHSFAYALGYARELVADLSPEQAVAQPPGHPNHAAWTVGHIAVVGQLIGAAAGMRPWLAPERVRAHRPDSRPDVDARAYAPLDRLLADLADAEARLAAHVAALDDARLAQPFPDPAFLDVFPTVRHALTQVLVGHTAYHVGQLAAWRAACGLPGLGRSFE